MKKAKMILDKFLYPPKRVIGTVSTASFAALIFVFASHREKSAVAYPIFLLSAYSLVVLLAALPALVGRFARLKASLWKRSRLIRTISSTTFGARYVNDQLFRSSVSIYQGMTANFLYMLFRFMTAAWYASVWFFSMAVYYTVYDGSVRSKPCQVWKNRQPDSVCGQSFEFCIRHDVCYRFADSNDRTLLFQWRGLP